MRLTLSLFVKLSALLVILTALAGADLIFRGLRRHPQAPVWPVPGGDPERGAAAIRRYGCAACHAIPGIRSAIGRVGPPLDGMNMRTYIAGVRPNTPDDLVAWIQHPRQIDPQTAMPDLGVTEPEARDIAAYLYSMR